ncbi:reverse transcriptase domain-containing protein [Azospirillum sp. 11R-A]|uniref:reverse transcriptase domain-containing protein n=1 Tax=Azospirillum sp. 11R-A TaxID=3111634 RepID=UPI003C24D156
MTDIATPVVPYRIFRKTFNPKKLISLFNDKISSTKAVGRDGVRVEKFAEKLNDEVALIVRKASDGKYKFTKYKLKLVSKGVGKIPRVLSIPTVRDRLALRAMCEFLSTIFPDAVTKKPHSYIKAIRESLNSLDDSAVFLRIDVKDYYPSIDRTVLESIIRKRIRKRQARDIIMAAVSTTTTGGDDSGIPQGLSISNILAGIYLRDFDIYAEGRWKYFRYVDDILIICKDTNEADKAYQEISKKLLAEKKLQCHPISENGKSCIKKVTDGVDYLGYTVSKNMISVREASYKNIFPKILSVLTYHRHHKDEAKLIWRLNLKISGCIFNGKNFGWMFFFMQTKNTSQLVNLDRFVKSQLSKRGLDHVTPKIKTFVKSYHEMRYKYMTTKYIINFDKFNIEDKVEAIILLSGEPLSVFDNMTDKEISQRFYKVIGKEVSELEKDVMEFFS